MKVNLEKMIEELTTAVNNGFIHLEDKVDNGFKDTRNRLDRIENVLIGNHERRIEKLEDKMLLISNRIGLKKI